MPPLDPHSHRCEIFALVKEEVSLYHVQGIIRHKPTGTRGDVFVHSWRCYRTCPISDALHSSRHPPAASIR